MSTLFAFRTATVVPPSFSAEDGGLYDPETQTSTFEGGTALLGVFCTWNSRENCFRGRNCNAYGSYCTNWGGYGHYTCD